MPAGLWPRKTGSCPGDSGGDKLWNLPAWLHWDAEAGQGPAQRAAKGEDELRVVWLRALPSLWLRAWPPRGLRVWPAPAPALGGVWAGVWAAAAQAPRG